jgi:ribonucleoside-triphosphate reductase
MKFVKTLDPSFLSGFQGINPPWGPVGYVTYKRTYARRIENTFRTEAWFETVKRCVEGVAEYGAFTKTDLETLYTYWFMLKCTGAGRHMWQLGTQAVKRIGADSLQNCWFVACNSPRAFEFAMDQLMLGGGVGFSVQAEHIYKLPVVAHNPIIERRDDNDVDFIVPDNREGWIELLRRTLQAFFYTGQRLVYGVHCLRARGKPIKTFGGTASGGEILVVGIGKITKILRGAYGRQLNDVECLDIFNIIGQIVVAGNVRRSAEIAIGDANSTRFLDAKKWQKGTVPDWRGHSNNTVACTDIRELPEGFWDNMNGEGEPCGLINLNVMQNYGRLIDGLGYRKDKRVKGCNPCGEIGLEPYESCNLGEIYLPNVNDAEFFMSAELMIKVCKTISVIPHAQPETREVVERNHRLGVGVTGFLQALDKHRPKLFNDVYKHAEDVDKSYSKLLGCGESVKLTTCKPSGTVSLLPGVTPGVHPAIADFYIRRIQFAYDDPLIEMCRNYGYHVEPKLNFNGSHDLATMVVEFPVATPKGTVLEDELTAIQQLEYQKWMQTYWCDNSVSCTVMYDESELPAIKSWLHQNYNESVKSVSFLLRGGASGFKQMPYEAITEEEFKHLSSQARPIVDGIDSYGEMDAGSCAGGACPVK